MTAIRPARRRSMSGSTASMQWTVPITFTSRLEELGGEGLRRHRGVGARAEESNVERSELASDAADRLAVGHVSGLGRAGELGKLVRGACGQEELVTALRQLARGGGADTGAP